MKIKANPIMEITNLDRTILKRACALCEELITSLASYTLTDDACITCADNGEVFATEKELYEVLDILSRMTRIADEAPCDYDTMHKILAVRFIG